MFFRMSGNFLGILINMLAFYQKKEQLANIQFKI